MPIIRLDPEAWMTKGICEIHNHKSMIHTIKVNNEKVDVCHKFFIDWKSLKRILKKLKDK